MTTSTPVELKAAAALYGACPSTKPAWSDLGATTQGVWVGYVRAGVKVADYQGSAVLPGKRTQAKL